MKMGESPRSRSRMRRILILPCARNFLIARDEERGDIAVADRPQAARSNVPKLIVLWI
jgi:hypothetical protein